jgi:galactokinase
LIDYEALRSDFRSIYASEPRLFSAPGRVNLIGEHTDYNDGFVLPMAIERRTAVAGNVRGDRKVRVRSTVVDRAEEFDLDAPGPKRRGSWLDYVEGTAQALEARGVRLRGADLLITTDVPSGSGLSSSAALEISVGLALAALATESPPSGIDLALAGQAAEHDYVGTMCGIMDQFISALGLKDHALLIDCRTLTPTPVPLDLPATSILICNTKVAHENASSEYNQRRRECMQGVDLLKVELPAIRALRDVTVSELERYEMRLPDPIRRRCRHVVTENDRTLAAATALSGNDLRTFGTLMIASHESLRRDYEVSCRELDLCVEQAVKVPGVYGARMTGGGFGGCTVNLVADHAIDELTRALETAFQARFGKKPDIFTTRAGAGALEHPATSV